MNVLFKLLVVAGPLTVAGCAAPSAPVPPPPSDHPASPQAAAAGVPERSDTLALEAGGVPAAAAHEHVKPAPSATTSQQVAAYTCPHHPEVSQATPGTCPKCKMKLEPAEPATPTKAADAKVSPDHSGHGGHESHGGHAK